MIPTDTSISIRLTIPELVREYNLAMHELKRGLELIIAAEKRMTAAFASRGRGYDFVAFTHHENSTDFHRKMVRMRGAAWRYLVDRAEIKKLASIAKAKEIDDMLNKPESLPDITEENLMLWIETLDTQAADFLKDAAVEVYEMLRPYNGRYKTNNAFKIGKRVVMEWTIESMYSGNRMRVRYDRAEDRLRAMDNVFHMLDGKGTHNTRRGELVDAINETDFSTFGKTKYFRFRGFRNGNLHIEFLRPDLVNKLNQIGGDALPAPED